MDRHCRRATPAETFSVQSVSVSPTYAELLQAAVRIPGQPLGQLLSQRARAHFGPEIDQPAGVGVVLIDVGVARPGSRTEGDRGGLAGGVVGNTVHQEVLLGIAGAGGLAFPIAQAGSTREAPGMLRYAPHTWAIDVLLAPDMWATRPGRWPGPGG